MVVLLRSGSSRDLWNSYVFLFDGPPGAGGLAGCGRAGVVGNGDGEGAADGCDRPAHFGAPVTL